VLYNIDKKKRKKLTNFFGGKALPPSGTESTEPRRKFSFGEARGIRRINFFLFGSGSGLLGAMAGQARLGWRVCWRDILVNEKKQKNL
jgi:hypothetical protein